MASVTGRIKKIKQPRGGYIKPSEFTAIILNDGMFLNYDENVHVSVVGMAVDYLTRFILGADISEAFKISLKGAEIAEKYAKESAWFGIDDAKSVAKELLEGITGLDDKSIINACKLVTFDVWFRSPIGAIGAKGYYATNPDYETIENIQTLVKRSVTFFEKYGPITKDGFTFEPIKPDDSVREQMIKTGKGVYGGYTATVESGDGDFLTADTLWDFKVSKSKPTKNHTLQLLMYWIMGQHSGQAIFKEIKKLGIFNPRLNTVYLLDVSKISEETIKTVEKEIICY